VAAASGIFGQYKFCAPALNCENDTPTKQGLVDA